MILLKKYFKPTTLKLISNFQSNDFIEEIFQANNIQISLCVRLRNQMLVRRYFPFHTDEKCTQKKDPQTYINPSGNLEVHFARMRDGMSKTMGQRERERERERETYRPSARGCLDLKVCPIHWIQPNGLKFDCSLPRPASSVDLPCWQTYS